ncbi:hypothetical protein LNV08_15180 [Paucibacter sp. TC2R-5]|uniref:hypothetical protein n=1 Tax=Paucibacter sp. TC2R-5 TaxID=2893555 RepID=UPI0021E4D542|nr:hypothetical protein [Paucibacter sp. TC2R-5]MCV2360318.1 hypothetical protein [Paucibacter sp. TC2R-5]
MFTASAKTLTRSLLLAAAALACAAPTLAAPQALGDEEMRSVNGGAQAGPLLAASLGMSLPGLLDLLGSDKLAATKSKLSPAEFAAAIQAAGLTAALQSGYDGQGGSQVSMGAAKLNMQAGLADLLSAGAGSYNAGNSMGSIAISNLDAGGTRLLVWHH